jgi:hypothetical protein
MIMLMFTEMDTDMDTDMDKDMDIKMAMTMTMYHCFLQFQVDIGHGYRHGHLVFTWGGGVPKAMSGPRPPVLGIVRGVPKS